MTFAFRVGIQNEQDVYLAIHKAVLEATTMKFDSIRVAKLKTAISELGSNILKYAKRGHISAHIIEEPRRGIQVTATDYGPGIENVDVAMKDHFSTSGTLGLGLPGVRRLMDSFSISSSVGEGTEVVIALYEK